MSHPTNTPADLSPGAMFTRPGYGTYWVIPTPDAIDNDHRTTSIDTDQGIIHLPNDAPIHIHPETYPPAPATTGQQPGSGLWRTVVTVEVLRSSADGGPDPAHMSLEAITQESLYGSFSLSTTTDSVEVSPSMMASLLTAQGSDPSFLLGDVAVACRECGGDITRVDGWFGVLNHASEDSLDGLDHDADADHTPVPDTPDGYNFCEDCMVAHPPVENPCDPVYNR